MNLTATFGEEEDTEWNGTAAAAAKLHLSLSLLILLHCTLKGTPTAPRRAARSHLVAHLFNGILTDRNLSRSVLP